MFEIDKKKFGNFISELRKEKGYTQKELAEKLFLSDKAISKWETGVSIPDTAMLIPLADILGVSVTELLTYERIEPDTPIAAEQVETILKTTLSHNETTRTENLQNKKLWLLTYGLCLVTSLVGLLYCHTVGYLSESLLTITLLSMIFGGYFCLFARNQLPTYYDENRISAYSHGMFRMNIPGVAFNNSNWPHILQALRVWAVVSMTLYPLLHILLTRFFPVFYTSAGSYILLALCLGGMFIPAYLMGKKYE